MENGFTLRNLVTYGSDVDEIEEKNENNDSVHGLPFSSSRKGDEDEGNNIILTT